MAEHSKIEWTDHTFNPWWGCVKVSPGCKNCYAETLSNRFGDWWGVDGERRFFGDKRWNEPLRWDRKANEQDVRAKVFCGSMCDVFEDREDLIAPRERLFQLIDQTPNLDWLLLTKRPENIERLWPFGWYDEQFSWQNIWVGTSVENQQQADARVPILLQIPAVVHFLSCEPLLELIELELSGTNYGRDYPEWNERVNWVIVGGESGPSKRPFDSAWARSIREQCQQSQTPFFMKQIDKVQPIPDDLLIRQFPEAQTE